MMAQSGTTQLESMETILEDVRTNSDTKNDKGKKNGDKKKRKK